MSVKYKIIRWFLKTTGFKNRGTMSADEIIALKKEKNAKVGIPKLKDATMQIMQIDVCGFPVLKMTHRGKAENANLFITGGGMVSAPQPGMVKRALRFAKETGLDVYFPYYPLCTDYPLTKAYEMILATYQTMLTEYDADNISLLGGSSGGNLALGMIAYMNATGSTLPKPGYLVALSPGACAVTEAEEKHINELDEKDFLVSASYIRTAAEVMRHGSDDVPDYMIFLQNGDYTGCPKTTFFYGTDEVLYALAPSFDAAMNRYGVPHEMIVGEGMFHCYPLFPIVKEGKNGWKQLIETVKRNA